MKTSLILVAVAALSLVAAEKVPDLSSPGVKGGDDIYADSSNPEPVSEKVPFVSAVESPGMPLNWSVYVMKGTDVRNAPVYFMLEFGEKATLAIMDSAVSEGLMPPGLVVFVTTGALRATMPGGHGRGLRSEILMKRGASLAAVLSREILPLAAAKAKVAVSSDPDLHFVAGSSAGGHAALGIAWHGNDFFRRVYAASPASDPWLAGLIRKSETKPLRVYITCGDCEPDRAGPDLFLGVMEYRASFDFAGYPCELKYFTGGGHNAGKGDPETMRRMFEFLWSGWKDGPVRPLRNPFRVADIVAGGSWEETKTEIPTRRPVPVAGGVYSFEGGKIVFTVQGESKVVADGLRDISSISLSSDRWLLYVAYRSSQYISAFPVRRGGALGSPFKLGRIELSADPGVVGAEDIVTLSNDRTLAATELGVQGFMPQGVAYDLLLPLPGGVPVKRLWMDGHSLFAAGGGKVFRRELKVAVADPGKTTKAKLQYGKNDGENRNSCHMPKFAPGCEVPSSVTITNSIAR